MTIIKNMIFHHPLDMESKGKAAAWRIRPRKMLDVFQALGYDVRIVMGTDQQRNEQIDGIIKELKDGVKFDFLYSENTLLPTLLTTDRRLPLHPWLDYRLFFAAHKAGIPLGVFYRDIYWRFPAYRKHLGSLITAYIKCFLYIDLWVYKKWFDVVFLPSLAMSEHFPCRFRPKHYIALPPGSDVGCNPCPKYSGGQLRVLYVGGMGNHYDLQNLCAAIDQLPNCQLTICCRKEEWSKNALKRQFDREQPANINVAHLSGEALEELYSQSHVLALTIGSHPYLKFAMPFKLFEYIAHRGPIICASVSAMAAFVEEKGAGIVVDDSPEAIRQALERIIRSPEILTPIYDNLETLSQSESWAERAKFVARSLAKVSDS